MSRSVRPLILALGVALALAVAAPAPAQQAETPVLITSCGQSPRSLRLTVFM